MKISDVVLDSRIGAVDRSLGFMFGAARGFLICVIGWVFLSWLVQGKVPDWAAQARRSDLEKSGDALVAQLPENPEGFLKSARSPRAHAAQRGGGAPGRDRRRAPRRSDDPSAAPRDA